MENIDDRIPKGVIELSPEQFLIAYMNEHYAHVRDHEHLRAQVTSILSAATAILIGLALDGKSHLLVGPIVVAISALNYRLNQLHSNRARAHMAAVRLIRTDIQALIGPEDRVQKYRNAFDAVKRGKLTETWDLIPIIFGVVGLALTAISIFERLT